MSQAVKAQQRGKLFHFRYVVLMIVSFFISGSFYLINTSLSRYAISLGASLSLSGVIVGCFSITSLVVRPFSGMFANRMKKKTLLQIACVLMIVSSLAYTMFRDPRALIFVRILHGVGFSLNGTVSLVLVGSVVPEEKLGQGVAYFGLAQMLASAVMPTAGAYMAEKLGGVSVFYGAAVIVVVGLVCLTLLKLDEPEIVKPKEKRFSFGELICVRLLPLGILGGLFSMFNGINSAFMLGIGSERGIGDIALYFTVNTAAIIFIRLLLSRSADRGSIYRVIIPATAAAVIASLLIGAAGSLIVILIAAIFQAGGQGMAQPSVQAECIKRVEPERRGTASSTYFMCSDIGQGLGAMVGGKISEAFGFATMYYGIAGIFLICAVVSTAAAVRERKAAA